MSLVSWIRAGVYALTLTPLVFWKPLDFFFDLTKGLFMLGTIEVLLVAYLWLCAVDSQYRPKLGRIGAAFLAYVGILILASILGVDPLVSFWSNADRMGGVLLWAHLVALFFIATSVLQTKAHWHRLFTISTIVGLIVCAIYLLTQLDPTFFSYSRQGSTFGNSTYLGIYLLFATFFASILAFTGETKRLRRFGAIAGVAFLLVLWVGEALAAKYAMLGGVILSIALWLTVQQTKARRTVGFSIVGALAILFALSMTQLAQSDSFLRRAFIEQSSGSRFAVWSVAWEAFQDRPILGWGLENFHVAFLAHYNPCLGSPECGGEEYWFDRAHNKVFDTLVEVGALGLLAYLLLLVTIVWQAWVACWRGSTPAAVPILVTAFLATYFVQNLAEFDLAFSLMFFVLVAAFVESLGRFPQQPSQGFSMPLSILAGLATLAFPFVLYHTVWFPIATNQTSLVISATKTHERLAAYEEQVGGTPIGRDYRRVYLAGETVKWLLRVNDEERGRYTSTLQKEIALSAAALTDTVERSPNNIKAANLLGILYLLDARYFDPASLQQAQALLEKSLERNPRNQHAYAALSAVYLAQGREEETFDLLEQGIALYPSARQPTLRMLTAVKIVGTSEAYAAKEAEVLVQFPDLADEIVILEEMASTTPDALYAIFF